MVIIKFSPLLIQFSQYHQKPVNKKLYKIYCDQYLITQTQKYYLFVSNIKLTPFLFTISTIPAIKFTAQYSESGNYGERAPKDFKAHAGICYKLPYNWYEVTIPSGYKTLFWKDENCKDRFNAESNNPEFDLYDINRYLSLKC
ncbi:hypothetical protein CONCODRAFT_12198 [Conidiobolus coronatus NRRL 28638]|uniref:Uncharacterized protein n=1 Tax=Conidiobolus coronatus (strain ATCC 28846 / CBS 209.66 / NRRL 28638) TaxID=796925 RepID=A0A137NTM0_CONC2|nr:hypothetical protein CONCODRAFT_12198 [Conidiobolus coronatus NRRL 28638]|eukprot:KXN66048.1 hypothetical protein CONCODRAFT_12198 [Conidiobolus coronatus NRRL 28638]